MKKKCQYPKSDNFHFYVDWREVSEHQICVNILNRITFIST